MYFMRNTSSDNKHGEKLTICNVVICRRCEIFSAIYVHRACTDFSITGFLIRSPGSGHLNEMPRKRNERLSRERVLFRNPRKLSAQHTKRGM